MPLRIASLSTLESPNHYILQNPLISGSKGGSLQKTTYNHFESPMFTVEITKGAFKGLKSKFGQKVAQFKYI